MMRRHVDRRRYRGPLVAGLYECRECGAAVFDPAKHDRNCPGNSSHDRAAVG
jgi:hypothetical protein